MKKIVFVFLVLFLAACDPINPNGEYEAYQSFNGVVRTIVIEDGTRCIFAKSGYGAGLSCDFK